MFEYKLIKVPFVNSHSTQKEHQPLNVLTNKIDQEKKMLAIRQNRYLILWANPPKNLLRTYF